MMNLLVTERMKAELEAATITDFLGQDLIDVCKEACTTGKVQWGKLKQIVNVHNEHRVKNGQEEILLHELCSGSTLCLPQPAQKPPNPQLEARRKELRANLENQQYAKMVSDITTEEKRAEELRGGLKTTQAQLSFGAHILVTMFTLFSLGYYGSKHWLDWDELWAGMLGICGLVAGLLLETTLLIIRQNMPKPIEERFPELVDPAIWNRKKKPSGKDSKGATSKAASTEKDDDDVLRPRSSVSQVKSESKKTK